MVKWGKRYGFDSYMPSGTGTHITDIFAEKIVGLVVSILACYLRMSRVHHQLIIRLYKILYL